jgi:predicted dehydrogenase
MNRRKFIRGTVITFGAAPFAQLKLNAATFPPADIRIGIVGLGAIGRYHLDQLSKSARVVALCDVYQTRLHHAAKAAGIGDGLFTDYRELLAHNGIDAVVIATPDHWHARMTIDACEAGKDVYVETPAATNPADGRKMVTAARRNHRVVQVGAHGRSNAGARKACEYLRDGQIGTIDKVECWITEDCVGMKVFDGRGPATGPAAFALKSVTAATVAEHRAAVASDPTGEAVPPGLDWQRWLGPVGERPYTADLFVNWRMYFDVGGGRLCGIGSQILGLASWIMQVDETGPIRVEARGGRVDSLTGSPAELEVTWVFSNPSWRLVWRQPALQIGRLDHGSIYYGSKDTLNVYGGVNGVGAEQKAWVWKPGAPDDKVHFSPGHLANWLECIKSRQRPLMDIEAGHRVATLCYLGNLAWKRGRAIEWDWRHERVLPG